MEQPLCLMYLEEPRVSQEDTSSCVSPCLGMTVPCYQLEGNAGSTARALGMHHKHQLCQR